MRAETYNGSGMIIVKGIIKHGSAAVQRFSETTSVDGRNDGAKVRRKQRQRQRRRLQSI